MAVLLADQLVAELGVETDRDLVRHRRRREEDRLVLAEQVRSALLELVDLGSSRRCSSPTAAAAIAARIPASRPGRGVRAEVDHARQPIHLPSITDLLYNKTVDAFAALADPTRRRIVELLAEGEHDVAELNAHFPISQPAVSRHLRVLREHGLVRSRPEAQRRVYSLDPAPLAELDDWLARYRSFWAQRLDALETELRRTRRETT